MAENELLPVSGTIDNRFIPMFPFRNFNRMQSRAVPLILGSDDNVVVSAPTASGKTVLAEAAMIRELGKPAHGKVIFMAPLRALTNEKESEWKHVLGGIGFKVYVVTGERELSPFEAKMADVIITTPEKWDSATRKYKQERYSFVKDTALIIIDEVHLLDSDSRGGALEAVVSRMKRISSICGKPLRIVALSATMPNISDVAKWAGASENNVQIFDKSYRPVDLETNVCGYYPKDNDFLNKYIRLYKSFDLIKDELADGHQALIFVSTRQDTIQAAEKLCEVVRKNNPYVLIPPEMRRLQETRARVSNQALKSCLSCGIAFHHAGLPSDDKTLVENAFREGIIKILISTSTLAWGVNLPARVVVIRDVEMYDPIAGAKDVSPIDLLQMLGRAGRPGYDTMGKGYVIVPGSRVGEYQRLLKNGKTIESMLKLSLSEHLNAEIAVGMVKNLQEAVDWLKTTFLYTRAGSDPGSYGIHDVNALVTSKLDYLVKNGFVENDEGILMPAPLGTMTSDFYLKLSTAILFRQYASKEAMSTDEVLDIISRAAEFSEVVTRPGESGQIKSIAAADFGPGGSAKVRAILMGFINRSVPDELKSDAWAIKQNASRLISAFSRFCEEYSGPSLSKKVKMVTVQIEKGVPEETVTLASIPGVGDRSLDILFKGGIRSPRDAADRKPEDLIRMGIRGPLAIEIVETARKFPRIDADLTGIPASFSDGPADASFTLKNRGGPGAVSVHVKADGVTVIDERLYMTGGSSKDFTFSAEPGGHDVNIKVAVDYADAMLPVDEWKAVIKAHKSEPQRTAEEGTINMQQGIYYIIAGTASVEYSGRAQDSYDGHAVVLVKPDSTIVVHTDSGVKPRNYMSGAHIEEFAMNGGGSTINIRASGNEEALSIRFSEVSLINMPFSSEAEPRKEGAGHAKPPIRPGGNLSGKDAEIEKALRNMRLSISREKSVPPYTVFGDRTIYDLIAKKPQNKKELLDIYGIGEAKAEKYGDLILEAISR